MHTSEDIRSTTFNQSRRGYEQRDVDAFIEQVANDMRKRKILKTSFMFWLKRSNSTRPRKTASR